MDTLIDSLTLEQAREMIAKQDDRLDEQKARIAELEEQVRILTSTTSTFTDLLKEKNKTIDELRAAQVAF